MRTVVELYKDGHREVCHATDAGQSIWTHKEDEPCTVCDKRLKGLRRAS